MTSRLLVSSVFLLSLVGAVACNRKSTDSPPQKPVTTPPGPEINSVVGKQTTISASSENADTFQWKLDGPGELSTSSGPIVDYKRPVNDNRRATLSVTAHNAHGASPPTELSIRVAEPVTLSLDAIAIPAGWMATSNRDPAPFITLSADPSVCQANRGCRRFSYKPSGQFGGIFWWPQGCGDFGTDAAWQNVKNGRCAIDILKAGNFREINRLTFFVRGAQGGEQIEFKVGASDILPQPGRSTGPLVLTNRWEQKEIDLEGLDLTKAVGLFAWVAPDVLNSNGSAFYLHSIQFEGTR